ncbi:YccS family putative transporter [Pseudomonas matsuisoli]|uniref:TIGR01666 family membrane protein n=1 Tax=Pseudomonas matsuisoli TaxID=1515666 RepID=A0A917Q099_9PSED|nr:YccS family putative transporter [Pseudomonas matsuisoli]GGK04658.1 TIGR01666 family membrane protein [Pseudomonas matsuisoli]
MSKKAALGKTFRDLWAREKFAYGLRVLLALSGAMALGWYLDQLALVISLFLGIIACALAETDDNWRGRLQALTVTLVCFAIASFSVQLLFPYPWLFVTGLALATFGLTMLGAVGERYNTIAYGTLILSVYTMIGVEARAITGGHFWREPLLLLGGAAWYGLLSVIWSAVFAHKPIQHALAQLFVELGTYLRLKSDLFEPLRQVDIESRRLALARQNGKVVSALNKTKEIILNRLGNSRDGTKVKRYLRLYFIAQDIHERASSSHYNYQQLAETFFHSDILFRAQRLLAQQGRACRMLAEAIQRRQPFEHNQSGQALVDLQASLAYLREQNNPTWRRLLRSLDALANNLNTLDQNLANASNPDALSDEQDNSLLDRSPQSFKEAFDRIRLNLTPTSLVFRHGIRLTVALTAGYGVLHWIHPTHGYWILLTTLFVCRPNYGATRVRLKQRIIGTIIGLVVGWALITLFPAPILQCLFAVAAGVVFFVNRVDRYTLATAAITLMVLLCFNQISDGFGLIWPRLVDTVLGTVIAGLAVFLILPDWQGRRLTVMLANTLSSNARYLQAVMAQYDSGKRDDLNYRLARRNAHNADAALSNSLSNMLMEPGHFRRDADAGFRFLVLSHTLLGYLSALGAHRDALPDDATSDELIDRASAFIQKTLEEVASGLRNESTIAVHSDTEETLTNELEQMPDDLPESHRLVRTQLALILRQLGPLRTLGVLLQKKQPSIRVPKNLPSP